MKYRAVSEAQARIDHAESPPEVRVFLGLETELPTSYLELALSWEHSVSSDLNPVQIQ